MFNRWLSPNCLDRIHDHWESYYSSSENRYENTRSFIGVIIVSEPVHPLEAFKRGAGKHIVIPERPSFSQKLIAFLLVQILFAEYARLENRQSGYAYRWHNARDVFSW